MQFSFFSFPYPNTTIFGGLAIEKSHGDVSFFLFLLKTKNCGNWSSFLTENSQFSQKISHPMYQKKNYAHQKKRKREVRYLSDGTWKKWRWISQKKVSFFQTLTLSKLYKGCAIYVWIKKFVFWALKRILYTLIPEKGRMGLKITKKHDKTHVAIFFSALFFRESLFPSAKKNDWWGYFFGIPQEKVSREFFTRNTRGYMVFFLTEIPKHAMGIFKWYLPGWLWVRWWEKSLDSWKSVAEDQPMVSWEGFWLNDNS